MSTTPRPTPEAVEAAIEWALKSRLPLTDKAIELLCSASTGLSATEGAFCILAAEVQHLRCEHGHATDLLDQIADKCEGHGVGLREDIQEILKQL